MYQYWIHYFLTSWVHVTWKVSIGLLMWYVEWYAVDAEILQSFILPSPSPWNPWLYQKVRTNVFFQQIYLQNLECSFKLVCSPCVHLFFLLHDVYSLNFQIDCNSDLFSDRLQDAKICNKLVTIFRFIFWQAVTSMQINKTQGLVPHSELEYSLTKRCILIDSFVLIVSLL